MKTIPLTQGKVALVDDEDYDVLMQYNWYTTYMNGSWYAQRNLKTDERPMINMSQQIFDFKFKKIDHINHNGLDNRRSNLRPCTSSQNHKNCKMHKNNISGLRGVSWNKFHQKWMAFSYINYKQIHLGYFTNKNDAARAVDQKAIELFGKFAVLNFPQE
jgi:hypothetical protein